ncbi:sulfonate transport system substrate-binding protein [Paenibacillus phyllosphaerae]|uniref:Putative aliphatic sulfonates-binding protein n=1 Tax=Paenibacillus phyllosphaerae TaxID=274593 RepID=A0A7W5AYE4_9BACL|nr:aliphatic sulfonate ABC transporter substrate-binding protein [Paenibacillus phyllosphaerae]MBB3110596.1 sulfonate transport system substrate-binding protein [Paenibacillus phyllosphaerae]
MRMKNGYLAFIAIVAVLLLLAGCGTENDNQTAAAGGKETASVEAGANAAGKDEGGQAEGQAAPAGDPVKVNIAINGGFNPLVIAQEKGWLDEGFKKLNAEVSWSKFTSGPPLLESLVSGRVDLSFLGDGAAITGVSNQLPFEIIGLINEGKDLNTVIVPVDSPIATVADLKGKTIGLAKGTTSHVYLIKILQANGLTQQDVKLINLQFEDGQAAFEAGKLDAWVSIDPYTTLNVTKKKAKILDAKTVIYAPVSMIAHKEFAQKHPELVVEYLKLYKQSLDWQTANPDEAAAIYSEQTKIPEDIIKLVLERSAPLLSAYTPEVLESQQASADILLENKFLKKAAVFKDAVDDTFVTEALK